MHLFCCSCHRINQCAQSRRKGKGKINHLKNNLKNNHSGDMIHCKYDITTMLD